MKVVRESPTIRAVWRGQHFVPAGRFAMSECQNRFSAGQVVELDVDPGRSKKSHAHAFAFIGTAWANMPETLVDAPYAKSKETLRKHALCATGHCDTEMIVCEDHRRALRMAAIMSKIATRMNGYALTEVKGLLVYCHTPHSQSLKAMGKDRFQKSKQDILEWMADLIGVPSDVLAKMGKKGTA